MSVGDVCLRADLQTDRFDLVRAVPVWMLLTDPSRPRGSARPTGSARPRPTTAPYSQIDEVALARHPDARSATGDRVLGPRCTVDRAPRSRQRSARGRRGDGEGLVDLAALGGARRQQGRAVLRPRIAGDVAAYAVRSRNPGRCSSSPTRTASAAADGARSANVEGATERADEAALTNDEGDARLDLFPGAGPTPHRGRVARCQGEHNGDTGTASRTGRRSAAPRARRRRRHRVAGGRPRTVDGEKIRIDLDQPITTDQVNLVQPLVGPTARYITKGTIKFDGGDPVTVDLADVIAHTARADGHVPEPHLPPARSLDRRDQRRRHDRLPDEQQRRVRRDPDARRRPRRHRRALDGDRADADRPRLGRRVARRRPAPGLRDEPVAHHRDPAARTPKTRRRWPASSRVPGDTRLQRRGHDAVGHRRA